MGSYDTLFLISWRTSMLFHNGHNISIIIFHSTLLNFQHWTRVPFFTCPCQHLLSLEFLIIVILTGIIDSLLRFWFSFPWWLVMLNNFSRSYWPCVYLLWKIVQICPLPSFKLFFFLLTHMSSLYIFKLTFYWIYVYTNFLPFCRFPLHFIVSFAKDIQIFFVDDMVLCLLNIKLYI